jgi:hypothetical protein
MELLYWRHPEVRMRLELPIKPRGSCLLCSNAQEIGACITGDTVQVVYVTVVAVSVITVTVMAITIVTVSMVTVPGFEWPSPMHATVFSIPDLKSKPRM